LGATLNWRRDPDYEQSKLQHEWRMKRIAERTKQIESDILLVESEIAQLRSEREQIESDSEQIEKETEQLRRETAREKALSASIRRLCFPPESSSTPQTPTEPGSKPFLPS
jgi:chromosome segregation ATPase